MNARRFEPWRVAFMVFSGHLQLISAMGDCATRDAALKANAAILRMTRAGRK